MNTDTFDIVIHVIAFLFSVVALVYGNGTNKRIDDIEKRINDLYK